MEFYNLARCLLLLGFIQSIITLNTNGSGIFEDENRQPRISGRIVKLYSGIRPDPILCTEEGFKSDPNDCSIFYRCVNSGRGKYTVLRFNCGPGTVYDPDIEVCNHPRNTKRAECNGGILYNTVTKKQLPSQENEIDSELEPPSPLDFVTQYNIQRTTKRQSTATSTTKQQKIIPISQATTIKSVQIQSASKQNEDICVTDGFVGDTENCRTFYRCVANGRGGFIKYEFSCSESTMWDDDVKGCNHAWAIKRRRCGRDGSVNEHVPSKFENDEIVPTTIRVKYNYGNKNVPKTTNIRQKITTKTEPKTEYSTKNQYSSTENHIQETFFLNNRQSYESESEDYNNDDNTSTTTSSTTTIFTTTTNNNKPSEQNTCSSSGFMGDFNDCRKFYRCVDNGKGSYTKYEFTCGEGTVWDSSIEACNHAWAVEKCGGSSTASTTQTSKTTTQSVETTQFITESNDYENSGYNNPQQPMQKPGTSIEPENNSNNQDSTSTTTSSENNKNNDCLRSGFVGDKKDCKKFYRCVDDEKGGFIKYEFTCGDGTVWDSEIESCNHESIVKDCGKRVPPSSSTTETSTTQKSTTVKAPDSDDTTTKSTTTTTQVSTTISSSGNICTTEGFMGDDTNCKKFYRCVDNGHGGFIKYEFSCGEGTVWDSEIQSCNHPSPNKNCGAADQQNSQKPNQENENDETDNSTTEKIQSTTAEKGLSSTEKSSSTTEKKPSNNEDQCDKEGFFGVSNDCKKFYRCVDNGNGGYTKYDFTCGEGTIWDQEIQGCNHASSNSECSKETNETPNELSNQNQQTTSNGLETESTTKSSSGSTTSSPAMVKNDLCKSEGFYANSNDCKKFYRCVSDDKGGYTKYDFSCGEGTIWVQEIQACDHDNDISSCTANKEDSQTSSTSSYSSSTGMSSMSETQNPEREDDEYTEDNSSTNKPSSGKCTSEGYYPDENDCRKFYRCVDNGNGGYTKYDFTCGEGTAWDTDLQTCNHENEVESCNESNQSQPPPKEEEPKTTQKTTTMKSDSSSGTSTSASTSSSTSGGEGTNNGVCNSSDKCEKEGYFGNSQDCTKFYRCVDNGHGSLTKYDFDCGEGTIWDQDVQTCNHPGDVQNPSCNGNGNNSVSCGNGGSEGGNESDSSSTTSQSSSQTSSTTQSNTGTSDNTNQNSSNCSQNSSEKPKNDSISCPKAGFYANPNDCKKFYRCVDWDSDGERYSVFHFDCGEGTIWDPELETCNYEDSVYPPRDCSGKQSASETESSSTTTQESTTEQEETTTTEKTITELTTTEQSTTEKSTTTTEKTTTKQSTTTSTTTEKSTTEQTTTEEPTTEESTTAQSTTENSTTEESTTKQSTTEKSTTQSSTTKESTTEQSTTEKSTTEQSTTEKSTTEESTTEQSTTEQSTTEQSTTEQSTTEQSTTEQSTTEQSTTEQSTTEQSTTEQSTTEQSTTEQSTTEESTTEQSTTEDSSTESSSSNKDCPETDDDQYMYVCPTGFRRHPKYCNLFYQCTEDDDTHEVKVAVFNCPNNTIYDESKNQCVEETEAEKKCDGEMAERRRFKRLDAEHKKSPIIVSTEKRTCKSPGHQPFEKSDECSPAFMKCIKSKTGILRGFVYRCPEKHVYWSVSRRCEPTSNVRHCKNIDKSWSKRWEIPYETKNIAP